MKKNIAMLLLAGTVYCTNGAAQNLPLPSGKPQLPTPKLQPIQKADLQVTNISLIEAKFDNNLKACVVKVAVTVKNAGGLITTSTDIKPWAKQNGTTTWKHTGTIGILIGLRPGESVTKELVFADKQRVLLGRPGFDFKVQVDSGNKVIESDELNNESAVLAIPALQ